MPAAAKKSTSPRKAEPSRRAQPARGATQTRTNESAAQPKATSRSAERGRVGAVADPRAHEDAELSSEEVRELHDQLLDERARVARGLERHLAEATQDTDRIADEADVASRHSGQHYLMRVADKEYRLLNLIIRAMGKLAAGEYGICEATMEPIGLPRLRLRPWARYSVEYKEHLEHERKQRRYQ